jgi:hypothetical protein
MHRSQDIHSALSAKQSHQNHPATDREANAKKKTDCLNFDHMHGCISKREKISPSHIASVVCVCDAAAAAFSAFANFLGHPHAHIHIHTHTCKQLAQYSSAFQITRRRALGVYLSVAGCQRRAVPYMKHIRVCM